MAFLKSELFNISQQNLVQQDEGLLATMNLHLTTDNNFFGKIILDASITADWEKKFENNSYLIDKITVQISYPDGAGVDAIKNSANVIKGIGAGSFYPMIWTKDAADRVFQSAFIKGQSNILKIKYQVLFKLTATLPVGFNDSFSDEQQLEISTPGNSTAYAVKLSLH